MFHASETSKQMRDGGVCYSFFKSVFHCPPAMVAFFSMGERGVGVTGTGI